MPTVQGPPDAGEVGGPDLPYPCCHQVGIVAATVWTHLQPLAATRAAHWTEWAWPAATSKKWAELAAAATSKEGAEPALEIASKRGAEPTRSEAYPAATGRLCPPKGAEPNAGAVRRTPAGYDSVAAAAWPTARAPPPRTDDDGREEGAGPRRHPKCAEPT